MCSLARPSALGFDAAAFLHRRRGVAAVAPAACGVMARELPARRAGAVGSSAARNEKRACGSLDGKAVVRVGSAAGEAPVVVPAPPGQQRLQERMRVELDAVRALHRKAVLLCRGDASRSGGAGAALAAKGDARREVLLEAAAKRRRGSPPESAAEVAAYQKKKKEQVKQLGPVKRAAPPPSAAKEDAEKKRRRVEEMAREREEFRRLVLAMGKAALPDETVYPRDLEELGIAPYEYAVTRTRSEALSQHRILVGAAY
ncbi:unnamed protein product [Urochloa decumbens]|uniref:Uncharacterized protein n=1 Tax=Urochloa decumbens TaxID=240449 RepID=A0ABC8VLS0_9POAL